MRLSNLCLSAENLKSFQKCNVAKCNDKAACWNPTQKTANWKAEKQRQIPVLRLGPIVSEIAHFVLLTYCRDYYLRPYFKCPHVLWLNLLSWVHTVMVFLSYISDLFEPFNFYVPLLLQCINAHLCSICEFIVLIYTLATIAILIDY